MKIVQLNAENMKRLKAVEIRPDGNLVEITGRNGQGKTSILDAIWWALDTNKVVQSKPVREGEESGFVKLDLGDYVVTKKFKQKADGEVTISLTVQNQDGAKYGSPTELLKSFIGDLTFDPLAFSRMKPRDQVVALRALVPDYDFIAADKANKDDFDDRTDINRKVRDLSARIDAIEIPDEAPAEQVNTADLFAELEKAMSHNTAVQAQINKRDRLGERIAHITSGIENRRSTIADLKRRIEIEQKAIEADEHQIEEINDELDGLESMGDLIEVEPISQKIADSERLNKLFGLREQKSKLMAERKAADDDSKALTKSIDDRKAEAAAAVRAAKLPVNGLELTEDAVLLNGQPFDQASDAEQLRVSIAVAGAMNPKLRVIRVRDGSLLDADSMKALTEYAQANDLQVWVETVSSGRESAVVIEDGMVVSSAEAEEQAA